jgi:probable phosphoglycerate mutase
MTEIYLIRHAEAEGNLYRRMQGQYNSLVTQPGLAQIAELRRRFLPVHIDAVYSSDLYRAWRTAQAVSEPRGLTVTPLRELREMSVGIWEDLSFGQIQKYESQQLVDFVQMQWDLSLEGGESYDVLSARIYGALRRLAETHDGKTIAVVSHGLAIRTFAARVMGITNTEGLNKRVAHVDNTAVTKLIWDGRLFNIEYYNDSGHLTDEQSTLYQHRWLRNKNSLSLQDLRFEGTKQEREVFIGDEPAGALVLDFDEGRAKNTGVIRRFTLFPGSRGQGLGIQLIGEAISAFRKEGFAKMRITMPQGFEDAGGYFIKCGFSCAPGQTDTYELRIGIPKIGESADEL